MMRKRIAAALRHWADRLDPPPVETTAYLALVAPGDLPLTVTPTSKGGRCECANCQTWPRSYRPFDLRPLRLACPICRHSWSFGTVGSLPGSLGIPDRAVAHGVCYGCGYLVQLELAVSPSGGLLLRWSPLGPADVRQLLTGPVGKGVQRLIREARLRPSALPQPAQEVS